MKSKMPENVFEAQLLEMAGAAGGEKVCLIFFKVKTLWEGHKIWKNLPPVLPKQLFLLSSVKTSGRFFQSFVAFSEKLNFTATSQEELAFEDPNGLAFLKKYSK